MYPYVRIVCMGESVGKQLYKKLNKKVSLFGSLVDNLELVYALEPQLLIVLSSIRQYRFCEEPHSLIIIGRIATYKRYSYGFVLD